MWLLLRQFRWAEILIASVWESRYMTGIFILIFGVRDKFQYTILWHLGCADTSLPDFYFMMDNRDTSTNV